MHTRCPQWPTSPSATCRARKCLSRLGITTLADLTSRTSDELLSVRNFGVTSLNEIRQKLADFDLRLQCPCTVLPTEQYPEGFVELVATQPVNQAWL